MSDTRPVRYEERDDIAIITLDRPEKKNTLTDAVIQGVADGVDAAAKSPDVAAIVIRGQGGTLTAGYDLTPASGDIEAGWSTPYGAKGPAPREGAWDPVRDYQFMGHNVRRFMKIWECPKPVIGQIEGWAIGGATDMILCADLLYMASDAHIGYAPSRIYGTPTTMMWVYRLGLEHAKQYLLTGRAIDAAEATASVSSPRSSIRTRSPAEVEAEARRFAHIPANQLALNKLLINQAFENMGPADQSDAGHLLRRRDPPHRRGVPVGRSPSTRRASARSSASATTPGRTTARHRPHSTLSAPRTCRQADRRVRTRVAATSHAHSRVRHSRGGDRRREGRAPTHAAPTASSGSSPSGTGIHRPFEHHTEHVDLVEGEGVDGQRVGVEHGEGRVFPDLDRAEFVLAAPGVRRLDGDGPQGGLRIDPFLGAGDPGPDWVMRLTAQCIIPIWIAAAHRQVGVERERDPVVEHRPVPGHHVGSVRDRGPTRRTCRRIRPGSTGSNSRSHRVRRSARHWSGVELAKCTITVRWSSRGRLGHAPLEGVEHEIEAGVAVDVHVPAGSRRASRRAPAP